MLNAPLAWVVAACLAVAALFLGLRGRSLAAQAQALSDELDEEREDLEAIRLEASRAREARKRSSEETAELRRRIEKSKRRAAQARDDERGTGSRVRELEALVSRLEGDLRAVRAERAVDAAPDPEPQPRPQPAAVPVPPPAVSPAVEELTVRAEKAEAHAATLGQELANINDELQRNRKKVRTQEKLYLAMRGELDAKKDRLRRQQEELERLMALKVAVLDAPASAPAAASQPLEGSDSEAESSATDS